MLIFLQGSVAQCVKIIILCNYNKKIKINGLKNIIKFTRLSISTKIPEYLASETPIIAIGPPNIASIEYLQKNNCAYIVKNLMFDEIYKIVLSVIKGDNKRLYVQNSSRLAETNHSDIQKILLKKLLSNSYIKLK